MTHIGLFAGIGGFELAAHWAGFETIAYCEINPFCQTVLKYYFPNAKAYSDIKTTDFTIYRGQCDILTGGPPCQPASLAGQRKGATDDRWLWPEVFRAVREIKPRYIVFENPVGIVSLEDGAQFEWILSTLENEGYTTEVYNIPACGIEAPHERQRIWFVAYNSDAGFENMQQKWQNSVYEPGFVANANGSSAENEIQTRRNEFNGKTIIDSDEQHGNISGLRTGETSQFEKACLLGDITDSNGIRQSRQEYRKEKTGWIAKKSIQNYWENFPTQSPICSRNDGISFGLDDITFSKWRNESIKGLGNAIVPQIPYEIFKAIKEYEDGLYR